MKKQRFVCLRCEKTFVVEVLEPGEAEAKNLGVQRVVCPDCRGPVQRA